MRLQLTLLGRDLVSVDLDFGLSTDCCVPDYVRNTELDTELDDEDYSDVIAKRMGF